MNEASGERTARTQARYAIGIGSNQPLSRRLPPRAIVERAMAWLDEPPLRLLLRSPVIATRPLGPSLRMFANAAAVVETYEPPLALLAHLQALEQRARRRRARRWGARTLDLDILLWNGGRFAKGSRLRIPHDALAGRAFVLAPLAHVARNWRVAPKGQTVAQLAFRLAKAKPVDPARPPR